MGELARRGRLGARRRRRSGRLTGGLGTLQRRAEAPSPPRRARSRPMPPSWTARPGAVGAICAATWPESPVRGGSSRRGAERTCRTGRCCLPAPGADRFCEEAGLARRDPRPAHRRGRGARSRAAGTVGAVALDQAGHLAAATSTGGRLGKVPGRVGDSPIAGAGNLGRRSQRGRVGDGRGRVVPRGRLRPSRRVELCWRESPLVEGPARCARGRSRPRWSWWGDRA